MTTASYEKLRAYQQELHLLSSSASILGWDQETLMPAGGVEHRAKQLSLLAKLTHEQATDPRVNDWLLECEADATLLDDVDASTNLREWRREYDRMTKLPTALVEKMSHTASLAKNAWAAARAADEFQQFQPHLETLVTLLREKAACYGYPEGGEPWDALAESYEPGCTAADVAAVFDPLKPRLSGLVQRLLEEGTPPANSFAGVTWPIEQQKAFVKEVISQIGFDFERGRLDSSTHPFCSGSHCNDIRMTTRYREDDLLDALSSAMHETGHGIYEQSLRADAIGLPAGSSAWLAIHESQSRMIENQIGRSRAFWEWCTPKMQEAFGDDVKHLTVEDCYASCNQVARSFIRVDADEATYNLHIMIRFELERAMIKGDLSVADLPGAWNEMYRESLGVEVPADKPSLGCLQDIHWSMGAMGYFPTYTLGNLNCAQFYKKMASDLPDMDEQISRGEFGGVKTWLNENIHQHGQRYRAAELIEVVTGKPLSPEPLMRHLEGKLLPLYGLAN